MDKLVLCVHCGVLTEPRAFCPTCKRPLVKRVQQKLNSSKHRPQAVALLQAPPTGVVIDKPSTPVIPNSADGSTFIKKVSCITLLQHLSGW